MKSQKPVRLKFSYPTSQRPRGRSASPAAARPQKLSASINEGRIFTTQAIVSRSLSGWYTNVNQIKRSSTTVSRKKKRTKRPETDICFVSKTPIWLSSSVYLNPILGKLVLIIHEEKNTMEICNILLKKIVQNWNFTRRKFQNRNAKKEVILVGFKKNPGWIII